MISHERAYRSPLARRGFPLRRRHQGPSGVGLSSGSPYYEEDGPGPFLDGSLISFAIANRRNNNNCRILHTSVILGKIEFSLINITMTDKVYYAIVTDRDRLIRFIRLSSLFI